MRPLLQLHNNRRTPIHGANRWLPAAPAASPEVTDERLKFLTVRQAGCRRPLESALRPVGHLLAPSSAQRDEWHWMNNVPDRCRSDSSTCGLAPGRRATASAERVSTQELCIEASVAPPVDQAANGPRPGPTGGSTRELGAWLGGWPDPGLRLRGPAPAAPGHRLSPRRRPAFDRRASRRTSLPATSLWLADKFFALRVRGLEMSC